MTTEGERLLMLERNLSDLGKSMTAVIEDQREQREVIAELKQDAAVRTIEYKHLTEKLDAVYGLGKWLLGMVGSVLVLGILGLVVRPIVGV